MTGKLPAIVYRPIESSDWPGELRSTRRNAQFQAGLTNTRDLLRYEAGRLMNAPASSVVVVQLAISEMDLRVDGHPKVRAEYRHPGVIVSFESRHGNLRYATDAFDSWKSNLRAIALGLEALRKVDRYGIGKDGEQYTGFRAIASSFSEVGTEEAARRLLDSYGGLKAALKATHPDRGGDPALFRKVQNAREVLGL